MSNWKIDTIAILTILFLFACGKGQDDENFDDLIPPSQGKTDTGYLSNLAAELEGIFAGTLTIDLTDKTAEERNAYVEELKQQGWTLKSLINDQMKCAKNKVNAERFPNDKLTLQLSVDIKQENVTITEWLYCDISKDCLKIEPSKRGDGIIIKN